MRKNFSKKTVLLPLPVYIIGTYDENGKANAMNLAWGVQCGYHEVSLSIAREHKTMKNILLKKEFTISLATKSTKDIADYFGIVSGNKVDKIEKSGVHIVKSENIDAPIIEEFPLTLECKVIDIQEELGDYRVIAEIINTLVDEAVLNEKGQIIATIDSSSKLEGENYVIDLKEDTKTINYRSSKILKEGNIVIKESRKITTSRYPINLLKDLNKLTFNKEVNIVINNNGKEEKVKIADAVSNIELLNTKTKATLRTNKQELYSVVENNDVEFVIELNNNKEESDIYGTSVYEIVLPNNIKDIKIKDTNILYGEGLKIENTSVYTRDGKKVIRVLVSGVQQSVNKGHLTNGTNLVVNTDISVDEETPKQEIQYNLVYSNVNATTYEQAAEFMLGSQNEAFRRFGNGIASTKAKIASPEGLVVANRYKNYSDVGAEVVTIKQGNKDAILKAGDKVPKLVEIFFK